MGQIYNSELNPKAPPPSKVDMAMTQIGEALDTGSAEDPKRAESADVVHKNIVELKAYCVSVKDKIEDIGDATTSSVIPFILAFGAEPENANIVLEYSKLFAKFSDEFNEGMGLYILQH